MIFNLELGYELIPISATLITLTVATYYDLRTREIAEFIWVPALLISVLSAYFISKPNVLVIAFSLLPALLLLIFTLLGLIGGADFLAMLLIGLSTPYFNVLPISLLTLLYSTLIPSTLVIRNFVLNLVKYRNLYEKLDCGKTPKWPLLFLGKPIKVEAFLKSKFMYPLTVFKCGPKNYSVVCRASFDINEDSREHVNQVSMCLNKGYLKADDRIWVTPALPHILFITIGYVLALITPEGLIYETFSLILGFLRW